MIFYEEYSGIDRRREYAKVRVAENVEVDDRKNLVDGLFRDSKRSKICFIDTFLTRIPRTYD